METTAEQHDDAGGGGEGDAAEGGAAGGFQKALSVVDLESRLDVGGEVIETVLSVLEGEAYRCVQRKGRQKGKGGEGR